MTPADNIEPRFLVALSFPGEKRDYVQKVADCLSSVIGRERVFYDKYYEAELARRNLDTYLQEIYKDKSALVVPFFCQDYEEKEWCDVEWRAIRDTLKTCQNDEKLMGMRFDNTPIKGFLGLDGYIQIGDRHPEVIADLILERLRIMRLISRTPGNPTNSCFCIHNLPFPSIGKLLKGRDKEIQQLLQTDGATAITQAIYGLGGIGKSRLAVEIGWHSVNTGQYKAVLFVVSDSPTVLKTNLAKLTEKLSLPEKNEKEQELQYEAVLNWFEKNDKWLLIFDNVDIDKAAEAVIVILKHLSRGRVLITSRRRGWPAAIHPLPLDKLNENDAIRFLMERTNSRIKTNHDEADAQRLAKLLDGLPLALEQAAAYIDANGCIFSDYLKDWEKNRDKILCWYDKSSGVPISVAITWNRTWDMLSPGARTLLRLISFLAPEPIPIDFLKKSEKAIIKSCKLLELKEKKINKIVISAIISELVRYSMIDREENSISVHRIVQEVIRMNIPKKQQHNWVLAILNMVNDYFPKDPPPNDVRSWNLWIPMQSHVSKIAHESDQHKINSPTSRLMNELSLFFLSRANYLEAEPLMRRALAIEEASLGAEYPKVATALNNLALLLQATNRLQEAEPLMRRALAIDEAALGADHPDVATDLNNLALLLQDTNRLQEAEPLMRRALAIDEAALGPNHPDVARDLNNLATLLKDTNRLQEAEPLMRRALAIDEASFGAEHPKVAIRLNNLAQLLKTTNRLKEAEPLMHRALAIDEAALGADHPDVATALNNLALLLKATNRLQEAEPLMRRALAIDEAAFGAEHPKVAIRLNNFALLLKATNRLKEAEPLMRRALAIDEASLGPNHPDVAIDLGNLATIELEKGNKQEAKRLFTCALKIFRASFDENHPSVQTTLEWLNYISS